MHIQTHPNSHGVVLGFLLLLLPLTTAQKTPPPDPPPYEFSPGMATVVVVLIIAFFTVGFISVYIRHFVLCLGFELGRNRGGGFEGWLRRERLPQGLDPAVVNAFPTFIYSDVKMHRIGKSSLECAICISEFTDHEILRMLPTCSHVFHPNCIGPWFELHVTCPVCRANLEVHVDDTSVHSVAQQLEQQSSWDNEPEPSDHHHHNDNNNRDVIVRVGASPESNVMVKSPVVVQDKKGVGVHMGKLPRSHSTGHSLVEHCERYTLRLPEEVRNKFVNVKLTGLPAAIISPRVGFQGTGLGCAGIVPGSKPDPRWRFSASPPFISRPGSPRPDGTTGNDNDISNSVGGRSGPRSLFKSVKSPLNRVVRTDDIGERSTNKLWVNRTTQDLDFEGQWHHDP